MSAPYYEMDPDLVNPHDEGPQGPEVSLESLQRELELERAAREREQKRLDEFLRARPAAEPKTAPKDLPLGPMPDPMEDAAAYARWHDERLQRLQLENEQRMAQIEQRSQEGIASSERRAVLWNRFQEKHPEYAARERLATQAFSTLVEENRLPAGIDAVVDAVKMEMENIIGGPIQARAPQADRTEGIPGSTPPVRVKKASREAGDAPFKTTHNAVSDWKRKHGFL